MNEANLLLRQVNPSWVHLGRPTSLTFRPTKKDEGKLSTYDGDAITPPSAWAHFTETLKFQSVGVLACSIGEFREENLSAESDPLPDFPQHVSVDYSAYSKGEIERKSKRLTSLATGRGWLYQAGKT